MKSVITVLIILCGFLAGQCESTRLRMRQRELQTLCSAFAAIKNAASYTAGDLCVLLSLCRDNRLISTVSLDGDLTAAWKRAADKFFTNRTDKELAESFVDGYGKTDLNGVIAYIGMFEEKASEQLRDVEVNVRTKCRLYTVLGLFSGVTAALLLI